MHWDEHRRVHWSPREFFDLAIEQPRRLINQYLLRATPARFHPISRFTSSSKRSPNVSTSLRNPSAWQLPDWFQPQAGQRENLAGVR